MPKKTQKKDSFNDSIPFSLRQQSSVKSKDVSFGAYSSNEESEGESEGLNHRHHLQLKHETMPQKLKPWYLFIIKVHGLMLPWHLSSSEVSEYEYTITQWALLNYNYGQICMRSRYHIYIFGITISLWISGIFIQYKS